MRHESKLGHDQERQDHGRGGLIVNKIFDKIGSAIDFVSGI